MLSAISALKSESFTRKTIGKRLKKIKMVEVCRMRVIVALPCPKPKVPSRIRANPEIQRSNAVW